MRKWVVGLLVVAAAVAAGTATRAQASPQLTKVTLQLKWVPQAQVTGYYAALDLGYYNAAWLGGNQYELFAALTKAGISPTNSKDVTIVQQPFDMNLFLKKQVDSASAMTYNELAQVLESGVKMSQINVIKMQNAGTGMLEDGMFATASWLKSPANQAIATKVIGATLAGWIYCRDHAAQCVGV